MENAAPGVIGQPSRVSKLATYLENWALTIVISVCWTTYAYNNNNNKKKSSIYIILTISIYYIILPWCFLRIFLNYYLWRPWLQLFPRDNIVLCPKWLPSWFFHEKMWILYWSMNLAIFDLLLMERIVTKYTHACLC